MASYEAEIRELMCYLCTSAFDSFRVPMKAPCGHISCAPCVEKWNKQCEVEKKAFSCSICRSPQSIQDFVVDEDTNQKVKRVLLRASLLAGERAVPLKCCETKHKSSLCAHNLSYQQDAFICINCNAEDVLQLVAKSHETGSRETLERRALCKHCKNAHTISNHIVLDLYSLTLFTESDLLTLTKKLINEACVGDNGDAVKAPLCSALWLSMMHRKNIANNYDMEFKFKFMLDHMASKAIVGSIFPLCEVSPNSIYFSKVAVPARCYLWQLVELMDIFVTKMLDADEGPCMLLMPLCSDLCVAINKLSLAVTLSKIFDKDFRLNLWTRIGNMLIKVRKQLSVLDNNDVQFSRERIEVIKVIMSIVVQYTGTVESAVPSFTIINDELRSLDFLCYKNNIDDSRAVGEFREMLIHTWMRIVSESALPAVAQP